MRMFSESALHPRENEVVVSFEATEYGTEVQDHDGERAYRTRGDIDISLGSTTLVMANDVVLDLSYPLDVGENAILVAHEVEQLAVTP